MELKKVIERKFRTPLGFVRSRLKSQYATLNFIQKNNYENGNSEIFETESHRIELIEFKIRNPMVDGKAVVDTLGWIWRIVKIKETMEQLELYCLFDKNSESIDFDTACGESLDAMEAYNKDWRLHIGTEDGEIMNFRAENDDWFPARLSNLVDFCLSITTLQKNGVVTNIPDLEINEKLHIHYLCAYDKNITRNCHTWFAVDASKRALENWIGIW